jgi:hypothetical protein
VVTRSLDVPELVGGIASPASSSDVFAVVSPNREMGAVLPLQNTNLVKQPEQEISDRYTHALKRFFLAALIFCVTGVTILSVGET